jgi:hypothetical protein
MRCILGCWFRHRLWNSCQALNLFGLGKQVNYRDCGWIGLLQTWTCEIRSESEHAAAHSTIKFHLMSSLDITH